MDNKQNKRSPDRDRINVNDDYELQYRSEKFKISRNELKEAVEAAGTLVKDAEAI